MIILITQGAVLCRDFHDFKFDFEAFAASINSSISAPKVTSLDEARYQVLCTSETTPKFITQMAEEDKYAAIASQVMIQLLDDLFNKKNLKGKWSKL